jgi:hypothetical protein
MILYSYGCKTNEVGDSTEMWKVVENRFVLTDDKRSSSSFGLRREADKFIKKAACYEVLQEAS